MRCRESGAAGRSAEVLRARAGVSVEVGDPNDATYNKLEQQLSNITIARDALAARMLNLLEEAEFSGKRISKREARP